MFNEIIFGVAPAIAVSVYAFFWLRDVVIYNVK